MGFKARKEYKRLNSPIFLAARLSSDDPVFRFIDRVSPRLGLNIESNLLEIMFIEEGFGLGEYIKDKIHEWLALR